LKNNQIGNPYRNHKLLNIESTERYISRHCWNVATYKWKVHTGKIEIMSFVVVSLTAPHSINTTGILEMCKIHKRD
jgi:hypothetical protein